MIHVCTVNIRGVSTENGEETREDSEGNNEATWRSDEEEQQERGEPEEAWGTADWGTEGEVSLSRGQVSSSLTLLFNL